MSICSRSMVVHSGHWQKSANTMALWDGGGGGGLHDALRHTPPPQKKKKNHQQQQQQHHLWWNSGELAPDVMLVRICHLSILAIANAKEVPGYYDPARFHVHCGIGRWQHCFRFGGRACGKCAFPAARQPGYYWASVCSREWLPQIVQVPVPHFFSLIIALTSFPSFQFTFNCD